MVRRMAWALVVGAVACGTTDPATFGAKRTTTSTSSSATGSTTATGSGGAAPLACDPGKQVACPCIGGAQGAQICADDGMSWGECMCADAGAAGGGGGGAPCDGWKLCNGACVEPTVDVGCGDPDSCAPCAAPWATAVGCAGGLCAVAACDPAHANCDGDYANGCEIHVAADEKNCGACGLKCAPTATCVGGKCVE